LKSTGGKAASCAAGLLPCMHGPCAFFRLDMIRGRCLDEYFDEWGYAPPHTLKLVGANLQLAEDRIPSLLGVLYSGKCNNSVFDAVFEFEAELTLRAFITQRRRWINGTFAGLVYALMQTPAIMASSHTLPFKVANVVLLSLQALGFLSMFITPALFGFLFSSSAGLIVFYIYRPLAGHVQFGVSAVYATLYVVWVFMHLKRTDANDCVLQPSLTKLILIHNALGAFFVFVALLLDTFLNGGWFVLLTYMSVPALPVLGAAIGRDWEGMCLIIKAFPVFVLASPSFVGFLSAYSAARVADLTWGNRPTTTTAEAKEQKSQLGVEDHTAQLERWLSNQVLSMKTVNLFLVITNVSLMAAGPVVVKQLAWLPSYTLDVNPEWPGEDDAGTDASLAARARRMLTDPVAEYASGPYEEVASGPGASSVYYPPWAGPFAGAVELYLIFAFPWIAQQLMGISFHVVRTTSILAAAAAATIREGLAPRAMVAAAKLEGHVDGSAPCAPTSGRAPLARAETAKAPLLAKAETPKARLLSTARSQDVELAGAPSASLAAAPAPSDAGLVTQPV